MQFRKHQNKSMSKWWAKPEPFFHLSVKNILIRTRGEVILEPSSKMQHLLTISQFGFFAPFHLATSFSPVCLATQDGGKKAGELC